MKKITIEETISILKNKIKFYNRLLALLPILLVLLFIYPRVVQFFCIAIFLIIFVAGYYKRSTVPRYINEFHYNDYKTFQRENLLKGITQQSHHLFIKSRYFKSDDSGFLEIYNELSKRVYILIFSIFILFSISQ